MNIRYKIFQLKTNINLVWLILKRNKEWDYSHFIELQIAKLTSMGVYFKNHTLIIQEDSRKIVRSIWKARKHLKNFINSSEILGIKADNEIFKRIGKPYKIVVDIKKETELINSIISIEDYSLEEEEIAKLMYKSIAGPEEESKYQETELKNAFNIIKENITNWWD